MRGGLSANIYRRPMRRIY